MGWPVAELERVGGLHPTSGLPGYPAHDYFARCGSIAVAPASGLVTKLSGHDPKVGPISGPHGPFGWSIYITTLAGDVFYLTHLATRLCKLHERVHAGQAIGSVGNYAKYGTPCHIHMGVHKAPRARAS
jgi:murein DD-endopeptidase MepM/ murein hydrolase activator NlpD